MTAIGPKTCPNDARRGGALASTTPVRPLGQAYFGRSVTLT